MEGEITSPGSEYAKKAKDNREIKKFFFLAIESEESQERKPNSDVAVYSVIGIVDIFGVGYLLDIHLDGIARWDTQSREKKLVGAPGAHGELGVEILIGLVRTFPVGIF